MDDIFNLEYDTDTSNGAPLLSRKVKTIELEFDVITTHDKTWQEVFDELIKLTDGDVTNGRVGTLFYGDYRLDCNLCDVRLKDVNTTRFYATGTLKLISNDIWRVQRDFSYEAINPNNKAKQYPVNYPYSYVKTNVGQLLTNESYQPAYFRITIYGAVNNPSISIGNNTYTVYEYIGANESLAISYRDESTRTIEKYLDGGGRVNCFNSREKNIQFFKKIAPGNNDVIWDGTFKFEVTLYEERGIPPWN